MQFEREYFVGGKYELKSDLVKRHVLEVVKWASKLSNSNLADGSGKKALDVGCAYGYSSDVLETMGYETYGVDVSHWSVNKAKSNCGGKFFVCDAQTSFPFRENSFDLVTCFDVLEHLESPIEAMENMLSVCRGFVVCTTPNKIVERLVRKLTRDLDPTHINVKCPAEWERTIANNTKHSLLKVETYFDVTGRVRDRTLFRSLKVPKLGLTSRILVKK